MTIGATVIALLALPASMVFASHTFSDVSTSAFYHDDVDAISNAQITAGCGGTKYCPNNAVTRGQMAVFLNKLGALGAGTTPVVDALSVNGIFPEFGGTELTVSVAETEHCETLSSATTTDLFIAFVQLIDPPSGGIDDYESWVNYDGVDPDEFNVCVATEDASNLPLGVYQVQIGSFEFIGQQLFSSANAAKAARSRQSSWNRHER